MSTKDALVNRARLELMTVIHKMGLNAEMPHTDWMFERVSEAYKSLAEYDATKAGGKWVGEEFFPNDPQRETAQGEVFGYVFNDISGAEHFHRGKNVPSLAQSDIRALYTSPPTRAPGIDDARGIIENIHVRMEDSPFNKYEEEFLAELIDAGVRVEVGK